MLNDLLQHSLQKSPFIALAIIAATLLIAILLNTWLHRLIKVPKHLESRRSLTYASVIKNTITVIIYLIAAYIILSILGINLTPLLASAGIATIIIGMGTRPLVEDLIAGMFLLTNASIALGDYVGVLDTEGYIENIGFRTLSIRDAYGALHIIPNGQIKQVVNYYRGRARVLIDVPTDAGKPIDTVIEQCNKALLQLKHDKTYGDAIQEESKVLGIENLQPDGKILVRVEIITNSSKRFLVAREYRYLVTKALEKKK